MSKEKSEQFEKQIQSQITEMDPPRRLIAYALDTNFFPDEIYNAFPGFIKEQDGDVWETFQQYPYITQLFWIRAFFENGQGNDIWQVFRSRFDRVPVVSNRANYNQLRSLAGCLPESFEDVDSFLKSCWIVGGNPDPDKVGGKTSRIWNFLTPLVRSLPDEKTASNESLFNVCHRFIDESSSPSFFRSLIDQEDLTFLESLKALRFQEDTGWLQRIAPLWDEMNSRPDATAAWMFYLNGNMRRLDFLVSNIYIPEGGNDSLMLKQGLRKIAECNVAGRNKLYFPLEELLQSGLDRSEKITISLGGRKVGQVKALEDVIPPDIAVLFRYPLRSSSHWLPIIPLGDIVFARRILVLMPLDINGHNIELTFNDEPIVAAENQNISYLDDLRNFRVLHLDGVAIEEPQELKLNDLLLASIGHRPYIQVSNADSSVRCLNHEDATIIFGNTVDVEIKNLVQGDNIEWSCENVDLEAGEVRGIDITIPEENYGVPITVGCNRIRVTLLFLPNQVFEELDGWNWKHESDPQEQITFAENGEEAGVLTGPNGISLRMARPLKRVAWWWQRGIFGVPEGFGVVKNFNNHGEIATYRLCVWVPDSEEPILLSFVQVGTIRPLSRELQMLSSGFYEKGLGDLLRKHFRPSRIGSATDVLKIGEHDIAKIFRVPSAPVLFLNQNQNPTIFFPEGNYDPADYSVVCLYESGIKNDQIEVVACSPQMKAGVFNPVQMNHHRINDEGIWLILVPRNNIQGSLLAYVYANYYVEGSVLSYAASGNGRLASRLGVEAGTEDANRVRGILDVLAHSSNVLQRHEVFSEAINERTMLDYSNRPEFWNNYYQKHCQITLPHISGALEEQPAPLESTLFLMLKAGFNWCAESNWLNWAYEQIPHAMDWKSITKKRKKEIRKNLKEICPLLLVQQAIEHGYPVCKQEDYQDSGYIERLIRRIESKMFRLKCPESSHPVWQDGYLITRPHKNYPISKDGINLSEKRALKINYHADSLISFGPNREPFIIVLETEKNQEFCEYMSHGDSNIEESLLGEEESNLLREMFKATLEKMPRSDDRGLGYMLELTSDYFRDWESPTRAEYFEAAVLSRLHAWQGFDSNNGYPDGWGMNNADNYNLVCKIASHLWEDQSLRSLLIQDLVRAEWMMVWFGW